jgi:hypothetical protein
MLSLYEKGVIECASMKSFVFLYPIAEYIDHEIKNKSEFYSDAFLEKLTVFEMRRAKNRSERARIKRHLRDFHEDRFRTYYKGMLDVCIDQRYRQNDYMINYALFNNHIISNVIDLRPSDKVITVGMTLDEHKIRRYPSNDFILEQLGNPDTLRIGGFHMWDCVDKLARRAYKKGIDVLVDEDLTEFSFARFRDKEIKTDVYPSFRPDSIEGFVKDEFLRVRKARPWLWQEY